MSPGRMGVRRSGEHRPGVQPRLHLHQADAGLGVPGGDRPLDGRGPAPAREQRGVDVHAAQARSGQDVGGEDPPVGRDHRDVEPHRLEPLPEVGPLQLRRLEDGEGRALGLGLHRRGSDVLPAPARPVRLGHHRHHRAHRLAGSEGRDREGRRPEERDARRMGSLLSHPRARRAARACSPPARSGSSGPRRCCPWPAPTRARRDPRAHGGGARPRWRGTRRRHPGARQWLRSGRQRGKPPSASRRS